MAVCHAFALQSHACSAHLTVADPGIRQGKGGGGGGGGGELLPSPYIGLTF